MKPSTGIRDKKSKASSRYRDNQSLGDQNIGSDNLSSPAVDRDEIGQFGFSDTLNFEESNVESSQESPDSLPGRDCHNNDLLRKTSSGSELHNQTARRESRETAKKQHKKSVDTTSELNNNDLIDKTQECPAKKFVRPINHGHYEHSGETDHDHDVGIERSDDDGDDESCSELDRDKSAAIDLRIQLSVRDAGDSSSGETIHSDHHNSTGYNADESLSAHCVDSDDKSDSTISLFGTTDKPIILRPRRIGAKVAASAASELVQGAEKLDSGSECDSCTCRGVQDEILLDSRQSTSLSRTGKISRERVGDDQISDHHSPCYCHHHNRKYQLGDRLSKSALSSQLKRLKKSSKCSESSGWSSIFQWLPTLLRIGSSEPEPEAPTQLRRRKSRRHSAVELRDFHLDSEIAGEGKRQEPQTLVEWLKQRTSSVIGADLDQRDMPSNLDYGTSSKYQALKSGGRRVSTSRRYRLHESNGHLRLGNNYHRKQIEPSCLQELKRLALLLIIVGVCAVILWQIYLVLTQETNFLGTIEYSKSVLGEYSQYAVSTDAEPCAKIGQKLLKKGGHAVDAALGTLICMGMSLPNSLGLGGGCLMTIYENTTKAAYVIDGREVAPDYASENMFVADKLSASRGPLSVGVPGELAAYWEAHQRYGRLPWSDLFEDSIKLAEEGFPTVKHLSDSFRDMNHARYNRPELRKMYANNATGDYYKTGEIMRLPVFAQTLRRLRDNGVKEFYDGQTGRMFIEDLQLQGGKMTMENLRNYKALVKPAMLINLAHDVSVYTQPIPGSGLVLSIILRIMKELGYYKNPQPKHSFEAAALYYHHLVEAFKFAYAQRAALEDLPDDSSRMEALITNITSEAFIKNAVEKIDNSKTLPLDAYGGLEYFKEDHGTAHVSVMDREGNSVAMTSSVNLVFGSGLVSPRTGILYNDIMDDFTSPNTTNKFGLPPSKFNRIRPGRRPISSMAPSVFVDAKGNPTLIIGASGGSQITSAIALVSIRHVFFDDDLKTAIDGARIHNQFLPNEVWHEKNFPPELLASIQGRGHLARPIPGRSSVVMAVACNYSASGDKHITANSDYRKGGSVAGL